MFDRVRNVAQGCATWCTHLHVLSPGLGESRAGGEQGWGRTPQSAQQSEPLVACGSSAQGYNDEAEGQRVLPQHEGHRLGAAGSTGMPLGYRTVSLIVTFT